MEGAGELMMEFNKKTARKLSKLGQRPVFGMTVHELACNDKNIIAIVADVATSAGLGRMREELPEQLIDVGIAEQNMIGVAAGLSSEGYKVITTTFAPFQTMRCLEQIRVNLGYMQQKVVMAGLASGMAYGELGFTHCCIEDIALMRAIPNIAVVSPADCMSVVKAVDAALNYDKSVYIRLMNKTNVPVVYNDDFDFCIGKANTIKYGEDVALIATGTMVHQSLLVSEKLVEKGILSTVIDMHTIKPIDSKCIRALGNHKLIVTVEEHNVIGGLGSAVAEVLSMECNSPRHLIIGVNDYYPHAGEYEYLLEKCGISVQGIYDKIMKYL